jgi:peptide deformylase
MPVDPARLYIVNYPANILRQKAAPIGAINDEVRAVARRMIDLMYEAEGIGLAAPQVGLLWRMFVVDVPPREPVEGEPHVSRSPDVPPDHSRGPEIYINPVLSTPGRELVSAEEGCLSLPEIRGEILRPEDITINAQDIEGQTFTRRATGLLARCWQHEYDHLEGVLILDRMSQMSRLKTRLAVRKLEREARM